ncbi:peptidylprolyl isomerase [Eubacterium sp.]|uniref:peptidylprolyl isomerase n=1 Tax=Eubacterium sp. TaxID=142586 RepID=UPI002621526B|nr:peptidylprolyl isomerase [Eubacterium sp.]MDD7331303.1 peptidylprolyl isomerase [Eubacterium sp.]
MDEKDLDIEKETASSENGQDIKNTSDSSNPEPKLEDNDNWKFDAEAPTLGDSVIANDEFEIKIPESSAYETAPRPTKTAVAQQESTPAKRGVKGDKPLFILLTVLVAAIIAACAVLGTFYYTQPNSDERMNPGNVALTVGETPVSIGMYNYYYTCISQNYITYAGYGYYDIDTTKDYSQQTCTTDDGEEITWAQRFENETLDQIQYITAYYEDAVAHGVTMTDEQKKNIDTSLDGLKASATSAGKSVDAYIASTYGDYCGTATLRKMLEQCYVAENYYQQKQLDTTVTTEEEQKYFDEHKEDYENVSFAYLQIPFASDSTSNAIKESKDTVMSKCDEYVKQISSVDDMKKLIPTACKEAIDNYVNQGYAKDATSCAEMLAANIEVNITAKESGFIKEAIDWLFDDNTKVGDCKYFADDTNSVVYLLYKTADPTADTTQVYSVRHILITPESDDNSDSSEESSEESSKTKEYTQEQWDAAEKKANEILDEYKNGEQTEYEFAKLAEKDSADTESTSKGSSGLYGGLCAGVKKGQMVEEFENWSTDSSRKYGDTGIVKSQYGYHIMYFIENTEKYLYDCKSDIQKQKEDEFVSSVKIKKHKNAMSKTKVAQPTASTKSSSSAQQAQQ